MANKAMTTPFIRTSTLLKRLFKEPDLEQFMCKNEVMMQRTSFVQHIESLQSLRNEPREHIIKRAGIERTYGHQLFRGIRTPSRDKVLQLAFGFELNVDETQRLLKVAQMNALYPKIQRDAVILHCINNHKSIFETQVFLASRTLTLLGGDDKHG